MSICTGDGRVIVGGTISIPNGSTVGVNTVVDEYGGAQASGSTVSVSGGSTTLAGTCIVGGTFSPTGGLVIANGSTISGVGADATVSGSTAGIVDVPVAGLILSLKNITFRDNQVSTRSGAVINVPRYAVITCDNCKFINNLTTGNGHYGVVMVSTGTVSLNSCYMSGNTATPTGINGVGGSGNGAIIITGGTYETGQIINSGAGQGGYIRLAGTISLAAQVRADNHQAYPVGTAIRIYISDNALLNCSKNTVTNAISCTHAQNQIIVGTNVRMIPYGSGSTVSIPAGTYSNITNAGVYTEWTQS